MKSKFFRFQFTCHRDGRFSHTTSRLFSSWDVFFAHLVHWSRDGYEYFETAEQRSANEIQPVIYAFETDVNSYRWEMACNGLHRHNSVRVVTEENAKEVAGWFTCSPEDAARTDFRELAFA